MLAGRVAATDGTPLPGAMVDIWQASDEGYYDLQQPDQQSERNLRGLFTSDQHGRYWPRTVVPRHYSIPADGQVGAMLAATRRYPNRPAYIHVIADTAGYQPLTTHLFLDTSPYLDSDAVLCVKRSLVRPATVVDHPARAARFRVHNPFRLIEFDIVLAPALDPVLASETDPETSSWPGVRAPGSAQPGAIRTGPPIRPGSGGRPPRAAPATRAQHPRAGRDGRTTAAAALRIAFGTDDPARYVDRLVVNLGVRQPLRELGLRESAAGHQGRRPRYPARRPLSARGSG